MGTKLALRGKSVEELSALPAARGRHEQAASRLLMSLIGPAYYASPNLLPIAAFTVVRLALDKGVCAESATGFALYGLVLCTLSDFEGTYRYGQVGMAIADRFEGSRHANRARHLYNTHVRLWKEPWIRSADALEEPTHERAYANGDFEYAAFSGFMRGALLGATGRDLQDVTGIMAKAAAALAEMQQNTSGLTLGIVRQAALNLRKLEPGALPYVLQGEAYDERVSVAQHREASDTTNLYCYLTTRMRLAYLFGEDAVAYAAALESAPLEAGAAATFFVPDAYFYECLTRLKVEPTLGPVERAKSRARLLMLQRKLAKLAAAGPMNIQPRIDVIAGGARAPAGPVGLVEAFDRAVRGAREQGYTDIEALALELAGRLLQLRRQQRAAGPHLPACRAGRLRALGCAREGDPAGGAVPLHRARSRLRLREPHGVHRDHLQRSRRRAGPRDRHARLTRHLRGDRALASGRAPHARGGRERGRRPRRAGAVVRGRSAGGRRARLRGR